MNNTNTKTIQASVNLKKDLMDDVIVVNDIDFLSKDQKFELINSIKDEVNDMYNSDKWMTLEDSEKILNKDLFNN